MKGEVSLSKSRVCSIVNGYLRFYYVSDYLKCFFGHHWSKHSDFKLGLLVVICWCCLRVLCKVPVISFNAVIVQKDFKSHEIFQDIPAQVELWSPEVRHACIYPRSPVMKVPWFRNQQLFSTGVHSFKSHFWHQVRRCVMGETRNRDVAKNQLYFCQVQSLQIMV